MDCLSVIYTMRLLCFSSRFFFQLHHWHALALFLYLPHQSVSFSLGNSAIALTTLSLFSCPLWRWEIWTAPKSLTSVWPHSQLPPSSPILLCSPPLLLLLRHADALHYSAVSNFSQHQKQNKVIWIFHYYYSLLTGWQNSKLPSVLCEVQWLTGLRTLTIFCVFPHVSFSCQAPMTHILHMSVRAGCPVIFCALTNPTLVFDISQTNGTIFSNPHYNSRKSWKKITIHYYLQGLLTSHCA